MQIRDIIKATFPEYSGEVTTYYTGAITFRQGEYKILSLTTGESHTIQTKVGYQQTYRIPTNWVIVHRNGDSVTITGPRPSC